MSTVLLGLALLFGLGVVVFLISLGLTALGTLLSWVFPLSPFEGTVVHVVLFALAVFLMGVTLLFERIKDALWPAAEEEEGPLDEMLGFLERERGNGGSHKPLPSRREETRVGRNDPCPCGSGKKYKFCCLNKA